MSSRGFTLVELMVTVAVAGLVTLVAMNWLYQQQSAYAFTNTVGQFRSAVYTTRLRAMNVRPSMYFTYMEISGSQVTFTLGADPDTGAPARVPFFSNLSRVAFDVASTSSGSYRVLLQGLMPSDVNAEPGKTQAQSPAFWSLNDSLCQITQVTVGDPSKVTCLCRYRDLSGAIQEINLTGLAGGALGASAKGRMASALQIVPVSAGAVIDSTVAPNEKMPEGEYYVMKDRQNVIQFFLNTSRLQWQVVSPAGMDPTQPLEIVFDPTGATWKNQCYEFTLGRLKRPGDATPVDLMRVQVLPGGEVR